MEIPMILSSLSGSLWNIVSMGLVFVFIGAAIGLGFELSRMILNRRKPGVSKKK